MTAKLYSIGYATKPIEVFIAQLKQYAVNAIADIRSVPYSKTFGDYRQETLRSTLQANHIHYVYLGAELGPRSKDDKHYDKTGQVQFDKLMQSDLFKSGINRLMSGLDKNLNIALMCAEKDPAYCHRSLLVGYFLRHKLHSLQLAGKQNTRFNIQHITHDGRLESQQDLEQRLLELHHTGADLFISEHEYAQQAYKIQLKNTSYRKKQ